VARERGRELISVALALAVHALFLGLAPRKPLILEDPPPLAEVSTDTTIDIEDVLAPPPPPEPEPAPEPEPTPGPAPLAVHAPLPSPLPAPLPAPAQTSEPAPEPAPPPAPAAPVDEYGGAPPPAPGPIAAVPGLGGPVWAVPGVVTAAPAGKPAPTTIEARPLDATAATRALTGTLHSRDKSIGLEIPAAGVVADTLASAVRASSITDTRATFEVDLDARGNVLGVRFVKSTDGDARQWSSIVASAKTALAGKSLQMGNDNQAVTVVVKVQSKVQYPAGTKKKIDVKPVCVNEVIEEMAAAMQGGGAIYARGLRDEQGRFVPYNELDEDRFLKFCIPIGVKAVFDLSNFGGAHMVNVVSSSFEVKRAGEKALPIGAPEKIDRSAPWVPVAEGKYRPKVPRKKKEKKKKKKP